MSDQLSALHDIRAALARVEARLAELTTIIGDGLAELRRGQASAATKNRIGRPEGRKQLLNLRIEQELLDQLRNAAAKHPDRAVAEETVNRLRRSFTDEKLDEPQAPRKVRRVA